MQAPQQAGCNPDLGLFRILDHDAFAQEKNLEVKFEVYHFRFHNFGMFKGPVAGNFFRTGYAGKTTDNILCYFTRCRDSFFPAKIEGVNTGETCGNVMEEEAEDNEAQTGEYERVLL